MQQIIEVRDLVKQYHGLTAVDGVSFGIEPGICFGLLGPNGAGKTTTVEMMEGIISPTSGRILYKGEKPGATFPQEVGIQLQITSLMYFMTVGETMRCFADLYDRTMDMDEVVRICHLKDIWDRDVRKISGGQRQRVLFALSLINDPDLIFLDEPTTGLDPQARRRVWEIVHDIKSRGKTLILTTHYMEEAQELCEDIAIIDHGRIIAQGSPDALIHEHCAEVTVSLPAEDVPDPSTPQCREDCGEPVTRLAGERVEFHPGDVNACVSRLMDMGVNLNRMSVRPGNLEDLFIKLTGRRLRD